MQNHLLVFVGAITFAGVLGDTNKSAVPTLKKVTEFDLPGPVPAGNPIQRFSPM